jgi:tetratricopeptide (TPR) repeat protein
MALLKGMRYGVCITAFIALGSQNAVFAEEPKPIFIKSFPAKFLKTDSATGQQNPLEYQARLDEFEKVLRDAEALLNAGKPAEAYKLLEPRDFEYSGNVRFDYALGISALDSGMPDKATLALERVLSVNPNFAGARLDMARAYFQLGDFPRAKTEFEALVKQEPPEAARITILKYLDAIAVVEQAKKTRYSGYAEGSFGRDSNVNNSTSQSQIAVPAFGNLIFTLSPTSQKTPDNYYTTAAGGEVSHSLSDTWGMYGALDLRRRGNQNQTAFDSVSVDTRAGVSLTSGDDIFRVGGTFGLYEQAHVKNRNAYGLTSDWRHAINPSNQLSIFAQYGRNRFADSIMQINDFDQSVAGAGLLHILQDGKTVLFGSLNWAGERAVNDRADGNKFGYGLRVGGQTSVHESSELFANAGYQIGRYDKENLAFLANRDDKQYDVSLGGNWHLDALWTVRPQIGYTKNISNIPIYSFDRLDASIIVRRDFK